MKSCEKEHYLASDSDRDTPKISLNGRERGDLTNRGIIVSRVGVAISQRLQTHRTVLVLSEEVVRLVKRCWSGLSIRVCSGH